ncbi:cysteinyl-tRNA(Pro) deacylase [Campylobacter mucosalis]|uniref:Cys-tRNA(Pro)/Cys-tRNA(Cys) deacylase n=1 Tax=Campylobacter mucosalis CCUG 21559 TaxID=1032067 RepID=A0A6G5QIA1_9BACT|nr:Cys-tRNA(Pro) deacylase [Campylobacter mucosalis]KEA46305.1 cysteinyl-tRNA(Pro) deacylase [Campylobacter mucosalis]QCD45307.1 aminoacyl-tRNA deacylase, YbaK family [Campylobacter mucosalis CCUG 21559]QKF63220.1 cysteinyl-tRNA(Pro) deacylase [Campylobacter mucosalis]
MSKIHKTNAARVLDGLKISYELLEYDVDESDLSAVHLAKITGVDIAKIYKTIVCEVGTREYIVACIQGDLELDLKALANVSGHKRCELLALKELEKVTGYIRGGCSPLAMKKQFATFIDERALSQDKILISAGVRGKQICINPNDLASATSAKFKSIARVIKAP